MLFSFPVNIANDLVMEVGVHFAPCPPVPNVSVALASQKYPPLVGNPANKLSTRVRHRGFEIMQRGHDCGPLIPHLTYPIVTNPWYAVILPGSSNKAVFAASTVWVGGRPAGITGIGFFTTPMMGCSEPVPMPTSMSVTSSLNACRVGMTLMDAVSGLAHIAAIVVVNRLIPTTSTEKVPNELKAKLLRMAKELLPKKTKLARRLAKEALLMGTGFLATLLTGNATGSFKVGGPWGHLKLTVDSDHRGTAVKLEANGPCKVGEVQVRKQPNGRLTVKRSFLPILD